MSMGDDRVHTVLIGRAGAGKSVIGAEVARSTQQPFIDIDAAPALPSRYRCAVHPVVADRDVTAVRDAERRWFASVLSATGPFVIAAPWSVVDNLQAADGTARIVLLDAPDHVLVGRLIDDGVDPDVAEAIVAATAGGDTLEAARLAATITIDTDKTTVSGAVQTVVELVGQEHRV